MNAPANVPLDTKLSSNVTIRQYRRLEKAENQKAIAEFIKGRFTERYIVPLKSENENGFCTMAICCIMIEALESFWRGWSDTRNRSELAFCSFFSRSDELKDFLKHTHDFYTHIRCGLLHQAETTGGWRIRRQGQLIDAVAKTINASLFHNRLEKSVQKYYESLIKATWNDTIWQNLRKKMNAICRNCGT
ncbi:MAG: hypothetical protein ACREOO_28480 [bacterium]